MKYIFNILLWYKSDVHLFNEENEPEKQEDFLMNVEDTNKVSAEKQIEDFMIKTYGTIKKRLWFGENTYSNHYWDCILKEVDLTVKKIKG